MHKGLLTSQRVLLIVAALLLVNSLAGRRYAQAIGQPLSHFIGALTGPVEFIGSTVARNVRPGSYEPITNKPEDQLQEDYVQALALIYQLQLRVQEQEATIRELRNAREVASYEGVKVLEARVISSNDDVKNPMLKIDRGTADGIAPRMAVEWRAKLVGVIDEDNLGRRTAWVRLVTAAGTTMRVRIKPAMPSVAPYEMEEMVQLGSDRQTFYVDVDRRAPVQVGDLAHLADDRYPGTALGRIVGKVSKIEPLTDIRFQRVVISPTIPLLQLSRVEVLVPVSAEEGSGR